ncbi:MAG: hypothetical protein ACLGIG_04170 [Actinomycetes bacterium]
MTETDELAAALDVAARRWPGLSRSQLVVRLAMEGHAAAVRAESERTAARVAALDQVSGSLTGAFAPGHLDELRKDWPR